MSELQSAKRQARQLMGKSLRTSRHNQRLLEDLHKMTKILQAIVHRSGRERVTLAELEAVRGVPTIAIIDEGDSLILELAEGDACVWWELSAFPEDEDNDDNYREVLSSVEPSPEAIRDRFSHWFGSSPDRDMWHQRRLYDDHRQWRVHGEGGPWIVTLERKVGRCPPRLLDDEEVTEDA